MNRERAADEAPFEAVNGEGRAPLLLICDHASRRVPAAYGGLGLDDTVLLRHIAWDIGAADLTRRLAALLDAPAVLCATSRLVIDCNRPLDDATSIPAASDGVEIPGNRALSAAEREARIARHFRPYHAEVRRRIDGFLGRGTRPTLISVHSFTPVMNGFERPWHVGLLWDREPQPAAALIAELRRNPDLAVGDNEPYSGSDPQGYAIATYGNGLGLPMAVFEVRQDLIDTHRGAEAWAHILHAALRPVLGLG